MKKGHGALSTDRSAGDKCSTAISKDISEGGMLLTDAAGLEAGMEASLEFSLPDAEESLKMQGKVVRKEPPLNVAVNFFAPADKLRQALQRYVMGNLQA